MKGENKTVSDECVLITTVLTHLEVNTLKSNRAQSSEFHL